MQIIQIVATIISILLGASQVAKEVAPLMNKPRVEYVFRGEDAQYRYWSDPTHRHWYRMDRQGQYQYAEITDQRVAAQPNLVR